MQDTSMPRMFHTFHNIVCLILYTHSAVLHTAQADEANISSISMNKYH